ncbi:hypothetical protein HJFPF1_01186 [Paramyrothecium foliicola]|nr:hypothetical protein HJFPF1_01186 [Paramyrothecium foliicola]
MEPPTKRPRLVESDVEDSDDDELAYEPHEVAIRKDPDYKLSLQRAYADHKFQATMAHIFEKYSRDFEGIGDEIDMVTGEIVVNNGHLDRMRNEADVGLDTGETNEENGSEDDGIFLGDLLDDGDDDDDNEVGREEENGPAARTIGARDGTLFTEDEDRNLRGPSNSLAIDPRQREFHGAGDRVDPNFDPYHRPRGLGFGASPYACQPDSYGFPASPFAMGPWELPHDFAQPAWSAPRPPSFMDFRGGRYEYPVHDGDSSIWAKGSSNKEDSEPVRPLPTLRIEPQYRKPVAKCRKKIVRPAGSRNLDDDEDFILIGSNVQAEPRAHSELDEVPKRKVLPSLPKQTKSVPPSQSSTKTPKSLNQARTKEKVQAVSSRLDPGKLSTQGRLKGDQELVTGSQNEPVTAPLSQDLPRKTSPNVASQPLEVLTETEKCRQPRPTEGGEAQSSDLRHASHARERVDAPDDVESWGKFAESSMLAHRMLVELRPLDPRTRDDYLEVNLKDDDADVSTGANCEAPAKPPLVVDGPDSATEMVIPDSQTSGSSLQTSLSTEHDPRSLAKRQDISQELGPPDGYDNPALSDDEAPLFMHRLEASATVELSPEIHASHSPARSKPLHASQGEEKGQQSQATEISCTTDDGGTLESSPSRGSHLEHGEPGASTMETNQGSNSPAISDAQLPIVQQPSQEVEPAVAEKDLPLPVEVDMQAASTSGGTSKDVAIEARTTAITAQDDSYTITAQNLAPNSDASQRKRAQKSISATLGQHEARSLSPRASSKDDTKLGKLNQETATPSTPRHSSLRLTKAPSSRRSVLSLVSDDEDGEFEKEMDELGRITTTMPKPSGGSSIVRKLWKSSARTTEVYRTPTKKNRFAPVSPGSTVQTPGGTVRTCGIDGYRCGRDFCFTCL